MKQFQELSFQELEEVQGGVITLTIGTVVLVGWKAVAAYGAAATLAGGTFGLGVYNGYRGRQIMNNHNLNLNTLLPKLATIIPLLGIGLNLILHLIRTGSLVSFDWQWTLVGLLASGYFGIFCKDLSKNNQNYK